MKIPLKPPLNHQFSRATPPEHLLQLLLRTLGGLEKLEKWPGSCGESKGIQWE
jgi:hypothetical protein